MSSWNRAETETVIVNRRARRPIDDKSKYKTLRTNRFGHTESDCGERRKNPIIPNDLIGNDYTCVSNRALEIRISKCSPSKKQRTFTIISRTTPIR